MSYILACKFSRSFTHRGSDDRPLPRRPHHPGAQRGEGDGAGGGGHRRLPRSVPRPEEGHPAEQGHVVRHSAIKRFSYKPFSMVSQGSSALRSTWDIVSSSVMGFASQAAVNAYAGSPLPFLSLSALMAKIAFKTFEHF